jgi:integrase
MADIDADVPPTAALGGGEGRYPRPTVDLEEVRLAVIAGLARCTGARYGDLLRVTVDDLVLDRADGNGTRVVGGVVRVRHGKHRTVRDHPLDAGAATVVARWLEVRQELCVDLEGSVPRALLLTVHHTHDNGVTVSKGLPITAQGLVLSWRRYVHRTAAEQGARRRPLPTRFEQVRRAWVVARAAADGGH